MLRAALLIQLTLSGGAGPSFDEGPRVGERGIPKSQAVDDASRDARGWAPGPERDDPQALVLDLTGVAILLRDSHEARELRLGDLLLAGDRVVPAPGGTVRLFHRDGTVAPVDSETEIPRFAGEPSSVFLRTGDLLLRFAARSPAEPPPAETRMGGALPRPAAPANGIPIRVLTPTLHWYPASTPERYRVSLLSPDGEIRSFDVDGGTSAVVPPEWALTPGEAYEWTVATLPLGTPAPWARFRVLNREGMDRVAGGLRELRDHGLDPEDAGALPAIALFQEVDLIYDALSGLDQLIGDGERSVNPALTILRSHLRLAVQPVFVSHQEQSEEDFDSGPGEGVPSEP